MTTETLLRENAYLEAVEYVAEHPEKLVDADIARVTSDLGIDLASAAHHYVTTYNGTTDFIRSLRQSVIRKGTLTVPQVRAALNVLQQDIKSGRIKFTPKGEIEAPKLAAAAPAGPVLSDNSNCETAMRRLPDGRTRVTCRCGEYIGTFRTWPEARASAREHIENVAKTVIDTTKAEETMFSVEGLPDGRYAALAPGEDEQYIFLIVKTLKKSMKIDRRFRYGKIVSGREYYPAGTILVREQEARTQRLCGVQKPGEGYHGEYTEQLDQIKLMPKVWSIMYARYRGACGICGVDLTDDVSRERNIGPDCFKRWGFDYFTNFNRRDILRKAGVARPCPTCNEEILPWKATGRDVTSAIQHYRCTAGHEWTHPPTK